MKMSSPTPSVDSINGALSGGSLDNADFQSLSSAHSPLTSSPNSLSGSSNGSGGSSSGGNGVSGGVCNGVMVDDLLKGIIGGCSGKLTSINSRSAPSALCSLCNDSYTDPKILPCLHTFCRPCLERRQVYKNKITCAQCYQECNLSAQGISGLLSDYTVYPDGPSNVEIGPNTLCTHCKDFSAYASSYCFDCNHFYCHECIVSHYLVNFDYHRVYTLTVDNTTTVEVKDGVYIADRKVPCQRHRTEELLYFCLSCNVPICKECTLLEHHSDLHEYELITNIGSKQVEYVNQLAVESKAKEGELRGLIKSLNQAATTLQVQFQKAQNEVHDTFLFYRSMLEERKQEILKELESIFSAKLLAVNVVGQKANDTAEKIEQACEFLERVLKLRSVTECVMYKKLLDNKLLNLLGYVPEISVQSAGDLEFVSNFQAIQVGVRNTFGYIRLNGEDATTNHHKQPPIGRPPNHANNNLTYLMSNNHNNHNNNNSNNDANNLLGASDYLTNGLLNGSNILNGFLDVNGNGSSFANGAVNHHFMNGGYDSSSKLIRSPQRRFDSNNDGNLNVLFDGNINNNNNNINNNHNINGIGIDVNNLNSFMLSSSSAITGNDVIGSLTTTSSAVCDGLDLNAVDKWPDIFQNGVVLQQQQQQTSSINEFGDDASVMDLTARLISAPMLFPPKSQIKRQKMIYHCKFGEFGAMESQFTEPSGVAVNSDNDIIVADTNNHRIQIFDRDGKFKFHFGECGKRDGQLLYPNRVAVIKQTGDIIVTERSPTHQIQIYNKYGQFLRKFGATILQHPRGIAVDNKGRIVVVECKVMRVIIFDQLGNVLQKFGCSKHLEFPNGVVVNDKQEIFISDNRAHCVKVFNYDGSYLRQIGKEGVTNYPIGVGINAVGHILIADNHNNFNLTVFTQDGQLVAALESKVKHAQCFDVALMDDSSVVLASKDYRLYIYRYNHVPAVSQ